MVPNAIFEAKNWQKRQFPIQKELLCYQEKTISIYRNSTFFHGCSLFNMVPPSGFSRCPLIVCFVVEKRNASFWPAAVVQFSFSLFFFFFLRVFFLPPREELRFLVFFPFLFLFLLPFFFLLLELTLTRRCPVFFSFASFRQHLCFFNILLMNINLSFSLEFFRIFFGQVNILEDLALMQYSQGFEVLKLRRKRELAP